jgi:hypothetical protein
MLRITHCLDNWLTDSGNVANLTHWLCSIPQKHVFSSSGTHLSYRLRKPQAVVWLEGLGKLKQINSPHSVSNRDLPACSIVPQQTILARAPFYGHVFIVGFDLFSLLFYLHFYAFLHFTKFIFTSYIGCLKNTRHNFRNESLIFG